MWKEVDIYSFHEHWLVYRTMQIEVIYTLDILANRESHYPGDH